MRITRLCSAIEVMGVGTAALADRPRVVGERRRPPAPGTRSGRPVLSRLAPRAGRSSKRSSLGGGVGAGAGVRAARDGSSMKRPVAADPVMTSGGSALIVGAGGAGAAGAGAGGAGGAAATAAGAGATVGATGVGASGPGGIAGAGVIGAGTGGGRMASGAAPAAGGAVGAERDGRVPPSVARGPRRGRSVSAMNLPVAADPVTTVSGGRLTGGRRVVAGGSSGATAAVGAGPSALGSGSIRGATGVCAGGSRFVAGSALGGDAAGVVVVVRGDGRRRRRSTVSLSGTSTRGRVSADRRSGAFVACALLVRFVSFIPSCLVLPRRRRRPRRPPLGGGCLAPGTRGPLTPRAPGRPYRRRPDPFEKPDIVAADGRHARKMCRTGFPRIFRGSSEDRRWQVVPRRQGWGARGLTGPGDFQRIT